MQILIVELISLSIKRDSELCAKLLRCLGGRFPNVVKIVEASVIHGFKQLRMQHTIKFTDNINEADALLGLQTKLKKNARLQAAAKSCATPVYVAMASSMTQFTKAIIALMTDYEDGFENFAPEVNVLEKIDALKENGMTGEIVATEKLHHENYEGQEGASVGKNPDVESESAVSGPEAFQKL